MTRDGGVGNQGMRQTHVLVLAVCLKALVRTLMRRGRPIMRNERQICQLIGALDWGKRTGSLAASEQTSVGTLGKIHPFSWSIGNKVREKPSMWTLNSWYQQFICTKGSDISQVETDSSETENKSVGTSLHMACLHCQRFSTRVCSYCITLRCDSALECTNIMECYCWLSFVKQATRSLFCRNLSLRNPLAGFQTAVILGSLLFRLTCWLMVAVEEGETGVWEWLCT